MKYKDGYKSYEEAREAATALLWENRDRSEAQLTTHEYTSKNREGERLPFAYIEDDSTGATAYLYSYGDDGYGFAFLTGKEGIIHPFRDVKKDLLPYILAIRTPIFKPTEEIKPEEALTPEGLSRVNAFLGHENDSVVASFVPMASIGDTSLDEAFETYYNEDGNLDFMTLRLRPIPQELSERTGVAIETPEDYAEAIERLIGESLNADQREEARKTYLFCASDALLKYALYEFFRTEDYNRLREVLKAYPLFLLSDGWEEEVTFDYTLSKKGVTAEEFVLARYLSKTAASLVGVQERAKEIAEYTNAPLRLMMRAYAIKNVTDI